MDRIPPELIPLVCNCMGNKDLLSMARSSHSLMEPALDVLWRVINLFTPLILLPAVRLAGGEG
ncbi:hypothetical protein FA13DRAFT_258769 [Coprinellus micaceus]|uniref:F-box domain-containing protein n=1 Tax=Coprinellus micaceus TaxID=71717 RepID=A0A4Y7TG62_COPMI|nr:hypothetical protein FA13DRAFT_258769 [Coprinellus micaceus]